ncbi:MAG: hypothetical protein HUU01_15275 [Saprospiraceae bacterium]|nr:hypothetical protein [Saprospiraceae bacterium]
MKKRAIFPILLLLISCIVLVAQPNKKVGPALTNFLNTEFMLKYRDLRISAESAALSAQSSQTAGLSQADVFRLRSAYDQTATRANQLLENIKQDFLMPKKLKTIAEFPEMYSDGLRYKLQELADYYSANFQQALADASVKVDGEDIDGSAILLLVVELIGLTKGLAGYFSDMKREARQYTDSYLQEHLVQPYRWRYWDELAGSTSPYEKFDPNMQMPYHDPYAVDPLDQHLQKLNQTISTLPVKTDNAGNAGSMEDPDFVIPQEPSVQQDSTASFKYDDWTPTNPPAVNPNAKTKPAETASPAKGEKKTKTGIKKDE